MPTRLYWPLGLGAVKRKKTRIPSRGGLYTGTDGLTRIQDPTQPLVRVAARNRQAGVCCISRLGSPFLSWGTRKRGLSGQVPANKPGFKTPPGAQFELSRPLPSRPRQGLHVHNTNPPGYWFDHPGSGCGDIYFDVPDNARQCQTMSVTRRHGRTPMPIGCVFVAMSGWPCKDPRFRLSVRRPLGQILVRAPSKIRPTTAIVRTQVSTSPGKYLFMQ